MEIGPVMDLEDVAGGKVCALASRVEPRDDADTARMLERYSPAELIALARRLDPGLTARDAAVSPPAFAIAARPGPAARRARGRSRSLRFTSDVSRGG